LGFIFLKKDEFFRELVYFLALLRDSGLTQK
jgi:hypothetical protein